MASPHCEHLCRTRPSFAARLIVGGLVACGLWFSATAAAAAKWHVPWAMRSIAQGRGCDPEGPCASHPLRNGAEGVFVGSGGVGWSG